MINTFFMKNEPHQACLKFVQEDGRELSLAGDDSCGELSNISRLSMALFTKSTPDAEWEVLQPSAEDILRKLADFLGYEITAKKG